MWLCHYLLPPTQSLSSLYKAESASEHRRSSLVVREFTATRTMRKTRLVILPGVRSITQIGCLLLFLACPTIAFKGQEKRDVEPICKIHELKYWWLPFDTGEGENSTISQKWTGYQCQNDDTGLMKGKDNVTESVQHSCDERITSHGLVVIHGQDANYNFKNNFESKRRWLLHSLFGSLPTDVSSRRSSFSQRHAIERNGIPHTMDKTGRIFQVSLERRVAFNKDQSITTDRRSTFSYEQTNVDSANRMRIRNRHQQNSMKRIETKAVNERSHSIPISKQRDLFKKTLSTDRKYDSGNPFSTAIRRHTNIRMSELHDREERLSNDQWRVSSGRREVVLERILSRQESHQQTKRSDKRIAVLNTSEGQRLKTERKTRENDSSEQNVLRRQCALREQRENRERVDLKERAIDNKQRLYYRRSVRSVESTVISLDRRMPKSNLRRDIRESEDNSRRIRSEMSRDSRNAILENTDGRQNILRHSSSVLLKRREMVQRSATPTILDNQFEELSRMDRRIERATPLNKGQRLCDSRMSERSVESRVSALDRRMTESNIRRNIRESEKDHSRRIKSDISRDSRNEILENTDGRQNILRHSSSVLLKRREMVQRSATPTILVNNFEELSRMDRRIEHASPLDKRQSLSDSRMSERSVDSRVSSFNRRMPEANLRRDIRESQDNTRRIRSEMSRDSRNEIRENIPPRQNTLKRHSSSARQERKEITRRSGIDIIHPKDFDDKSRIDRRIERAASFDNRQSSDIRRSKRSVESRVSSLDRRMPKSNLRRDIRESEGNSRRFRSEMSRDSRNEILEKTDRRQNILQHSTSVLLNRREIVQRSSTPTILGNHFEELSRMDRRIEHDSPLDKRQSLSDSRISERSVDSRVSSFNRRMPEANLRRDIRESQDNTRRIRSEMSRDTRNEIRENIPPRQNTLKRHSSSARQERKEITRRSGIDIIHPKDFDDKSRIDRRIERAASLDNRQSSDIRRSKRSVESRVSSLDRRMPKSNLRRDIRESEDNSRRFRSEMSRDSRNEILEKTDRRQNILQHSTSVLLNRREIVQRSSTPTILGNHFEELSRMDRRIEHDSPLDKRQSLSDSRISERSVDSRVSSFNRRMPEANLRRDIRESQDNTRRIRSEMSRDTRNEIRENIQRRQNILRLRTNQDKDFDEQSRLDRRIERATTSDKGQHLSASRRSERSVGSRVSPLDRRMAESNIRRDIRESEKDNTRRLSSEILRDSKNEIRENIPPRQNTLKRHSSSARQERKEITRGSGIAIIHPKDSDERTRIDRRIERAASFDNRQSSDIRRSKRFVESRISSLDRRMPKSNLRRNIREAEDNSRRIRSEISRDSRNEIVENTDRRHNILRHSSSVLLERREMVQRSGIRTNQDKDFDEQSRLDRRVERVTPLNKGQHLSDSRRSERSVESRVYPLDRRMPESNIRRDIRESEKDNSRRIKSDMLRDSRSEIFENNERRQTILRHSSPVLLQERREMIQRSGITTNQAKYFDEQSRLSRRIERAIPLVKGQPLSDSRRSERSVDSRVSPLGRRMPESNIRRDVRESEDNTRRMRSEMTRDSRNEIRENIPQRQNTLKRRNSSGRQERKEITRQSGIDIIHSNDFEEQSILDRRIERAASFDKRQWSDIRRSKRSDESRVSSHDRRMPESNLRRDIRESDVNTRRVRSEMSRDSRNEIRENIERRQNILRHCSPVLLERREMIQRSKITTNQAKYFDEQSSLDRRIERATPLDKGQRLSDSRRSERSTESRVSALNRRMPESNIRRDIREYDVNTRRIRSDMSRDSRNEIRENIPPRQNTLKRHRSSARQERKETTRRSEIDIIHPKDFDEQSRIDRRIERAASFDNRQSSDIRRSKRSVESRESSLDRRMPKSNLRRDIRESEDNSRRIRLEMSRDSRNEILENTDGRQNILRHSSSVLLKRREIVQRSATPTILDNHFEELSRMDRRIERATPLNKGQRLSDSRRSERSVESRVSVSALDRRMTESNIRRNIRESEKDNTRRMRSEMSGASRNEIRENIERRQNILRHSSPVLLEHRQMIQRSATPTILGNHLEELSRMDRRIERSSALDKGQDLSDSRMSERSVYSRVSSFNRRMPQANLRRDTKESQDNTRRIRSEMSRDSRNEIRENIQRRQNILRRSSHILLERKEMTQRSAILTIQAKNFDEQSRMDRRIERVIPLAKGQRLSDSRRSERSVEFRSFSLDRRMPESNLRRDAAINENDRSSKVGSEFSRETRNALRGNVSPRQNALLRQRSRARLEPSKTTQRSVVALVQHINFERQPIMDRRHGPVVSTDKEQQLSHIEKSGAVMESRALFLNRKMTGSTLRQSIVRHKKYNSHEGLFPRRLRTEPSLVSFARGIITPVQRRVSYDSQSSQKTHSGQKPHNSHRDSKPELNPGNEPVISPHYDKSKVYNAQKSAESFSSWIGEMISTIIKAVIGNAIEENVLKHPMDSGVIRMSNYLPGFTHERQISKLLPDSELSNDKGHLLQDFVFSSVIAGYFISSFHLKIRDYRNIICIF